MKVTRFRVLLVALVAMLAIGGVGVSVAVGKGTRGNDKTPPDSVNAVAATTTCTSAYCYGISSGFTVTHGTQLIGATMLCPSVAHATGGGVFSSSANTAASVNSSLPIDSGADADTVPDDGWRIDYNNASAVNFTIFVYVICKVPVSVP
jgi:hypothetical protein